jgi:monooxygenase
VKAEIARAVPAYAGLVEEHIGSLADLTLLDVFSGTARTWATDGLLLIGDAAHTHSPIGAQGINLALQDAVAAHPVLLRSLHRRDARAGTLAAFAERRGPDVRAVFRIQVMQSRAMLSQNRVAALVRPWAARALSRTPVFAAVLRRLAYGDADLRVADELFTAG